MQIAGQKITHPDRVVYPDAGITKGEVAQWYAEQAARLLAHGKDRPASLVRCPEGIARDCFFQKHSGALPVEIAKASIMEKDGQRADYILLRDRIGLVAGAQMGMLEVHLWGARIDSIERPDRLVMDLDPGPGVDFAAIRQAALEVRGELGRAGLVSYCLLTGGKGIHVVAPLTRRQDWETLGDTAEGLARRMAADAPDRYVASAPKDKRRGRIFIDWLRNRRGATAIAPYSLRARPGAPVATPVAWEELSEIDAASQFTLRTIAPRLDRTAGDPWADYHGQRQSLSRAVRDALTGKA